MRSNRHFVPSILALLSIPSRFAPAGAKVTPRDADAGALGTRLTSAEGNITSLQGDVSDVQSDLSSVGSRVTSVEETTDYLATNAQGLGLELDYGPVDKEGTGLAVEQTLTMPAPLTLTDGHAYSFSAKQIKASKPAGAGGALLYSAKIEGFQLLRESGAWVTTPLSKGNLVLNDDVHADIADYFAVAGDRPVFGVTSSNVTLAWKAIDTMHFTLELDGEVTDDGVYTP